MPPRLVDLYHPGDAVEILLSDEEGEMWRPALVRGSSIPASGCRPRIGGCGSSPTGAGFAREMQRARRKPLVSCLPDSLRFSARVHRSGVFGLFPSSA